MTMIEKNEPDFEREYTRGVLRSEIVSLFWAVISDRKKKTDGFTFQGLADALGVHKSQVSRWFNGLPNWEVNTIADIAEALEIDVQFMARDRMDGRIYASSGSSGIVMTTTTGAVTSGIQSHSPAATGRQKAGCFAFTEIAA